MPRTRPRPFAPRPGRRERRRAETRERLFRAALRLFAERGFTATTIEDITEAADVGKGTFFNYFPSKEHVLAAFGELQRGKVEQAMAAARGNPGPIRKILNRLVRALAEEPGRSPALFRSLLIACLSSEAVRAMVGRNLALGRKRLAELLALGQKRGEVRRDLDSVELARAFQQTLFGTLLFWSLELAAKPEGRLDIAFDLFFSGIRAKPARPGASP